MEYQIRTIKIINLNIRKDRDQNPLNQIFLEATALYRNSHIFVYTDASKNNSRVGFGIHIPQINYNFSSRLPNNLCICTAEVIAIYEAIKVILKKGIKDVIIFSDSQGAISKIRKTDVHPNRDRISLTAKRLLLIANDCGANIAIAWIPGHSQILGNEKVDILAKIGTNLNIPMKIDLEKADVVNKIKGRIIEEHSISWQETLKTKGTSYAKVMSSFPKKKWFSEFEFVDRKHITTIIRMRTGHCLTASHLSKIKIKTDPNCECGMEETLDHIFLECPINTIPGFDIYQDLVRSGLRPPLNTAIILSNLSEYRIKILIRFLTFNKIKL